MRVICSDLKLFPYKVQISEAQIQANKNQRCYFCQSISEQIENNRRLYAILFSDRAYFHVNGHGTKQNIRFWALAQPHEQCASTPEC